MELHIDGWNAKQLHTKNQVDGYQGKSYWKEKKRLLPRQLITLVAQAKVYYSQSSFQTSKKKESHSRNKVEKQTTKAKTTKEEHEINWWVMSTALYLIPWMWFGYPSWFHSYPCTMRPALRSSPCISITTILIPIKSSSSLTTVDLLCNNFIGYNLSS